jgi:site-specific DNA-methyltransferase (adenine-specific)
MTNNMTLTETLNTIILGDCYEFMKCLPDKCIDVVIADPPYGINVLKNNRIGGLRSGYTNSYKPMINDDVKVDLTELFRVSKHQIIFGGNYFDLPVTKSWVVWDKKLQNDWNDDFSDGELIWTSFSRPLRIHRHLYVGFIQSEREIRCHPTQKPIGLMKWLINNYTHIDDVIFDPFMGSGSTCIAAKQLNRKYIGCELDADYFNIASKRLKQIIAVNEFFG